jgi:NAD-dependent deacetylase
MIVNVMVDLPTAAAWIRDATAVTVLTGAGISTESGIPDFRGPQGVWTKDPAAEKTAMLSYYLEDDEVRRTSWRNRLTSPVFTAKPNAAHLALAGLPNLVAIATQNIDGLHQAAGTDPDRVLELHGNAHRTRCWSCHDIRTMSEAVERVRGGDDDPRCLLCGGILKSTTVSFGENLDPEVLRRAVAAVDQADLFIAAGSSLAVYPAAALLPQAKRAGARVIIANATPTPYDDLADAVFSDSLATVLPALTGRECRPSE